MRLCRALSQINHPAEKPPLKNGSSTIAIVPKRLAEAAVGGKSSLAAPKSPRLSVIGTDLSNFRVSVCDRRGHSRDGSQCYLLPLICQGKSMQSSLVALVHRTLRRASQAMCRPWRRFGPSHRLSKAGALPIVLRASLERKCWGLVRQAPTPASPAGRVEPVAWASHASRASSGNARLTRSVVCRLALARSYWGLAGGGSCVQHELP